MCGLWLVGRERGAGRACLRISHACHSEDRLDALLRCKNWLSQAPKVARQWEHVWTIDALPLPPAAVIEANVVHDNPSNVIADDYWY